MMPKAKKEVKPKKEKKPKKLTGLEFVKKEMEKGLMTKPRLTDPENIMCRNLVTQYYSVQEVRKAVSNNINMVKRDYKKYKFSTEPQERILAQVEMLEKKILEELTEYAKSLRIYAWLSQIEGIGPVIAIGLISGYICPDRFEYPTKMNRYGGLAPVDWCKNCNSRYVHPSMKEAWVEKEAQYIEKRKSKKKQDVKGTEKKLLALLCKCGNPQVVQVAEKKVRGLPIHYSPFLKTLLTFKLGHLGFIMHKGYYRNHYDKFRAEEDRKSPLLTDGERYSRARRKTVKLFNNHFWTAWRRINGLPVAEPYVMRMGNHQYIPPPHEDIIRFLEEDWKQRHRTLSPSKTGKKVKTGKRIAKRKESQN